MNMDAVKHNRARVLILKILAPQHPNPTDAVLLRRVLADWGYPIAEHSLKSYLAYLAERGCITIETKKDFDITLAAITAKGLDLLDGRITEPGIELD